MSQRCLCVKGQGTEPHQRRPPSGVQRLLQGDHGLQTPWEANDQRYVEWEGSVVRHGRNSNSFRVIAFKRKA